MASLTADLSGYIVYTLMQLHCAEPSLRGKFIPSLVLRLSAVN